MVKVILIKKTTNQKLSDIKNFDLENLYKKCNLRKPDNFKKRHTWKMGNSNFYISIYAKDTGRSNSENKYDLPPPIDKTLYFGSLVLVKHEGEEVMEMFNSLHLSVHKIDASKDIWKVK